MKILFLSQIVPYPPHGGVLQRGYNVIREISKSFDIHLLAFIHPDILNSPAQIEESRKELEKFCVEIEYFELWPKKTRFHANLAIMLGLFTGFPFSVLAHRSTVFKNRISEILLAGKIDMLHFDTIGLAQYYHDKLPYPAVLTHHNIESRLMSRRAQVEKNILKKFYLNLQAKRLRRYEVANSIKFSGNIMMSKLEAEELKKMAPLAHTVIIPNGVDTQYFYPRPGEETTTLIYTGGMNMYANKDAVIYFLYEIWPLIKLKIPDCNFIAIGQDPSNEILKFAQKDSSVKVPGYVDDVRPYVAKSSVYIVPLRVGGGTRLKVVDAMAQGKAIVSTTLGSEGLRVTPGENIIIVDEPELFAAEVVSLLNDKTKREKIGSAARQMVEEHYAWDIIGEDIYNMYEELVERKP